MKTATKHTIFVGLSIVGTVSIYLFRADFSIGFTDSSNLADSTINSTATSQVSANNKWSKVYNGLERDRPLRIIGMNDVLLRNSIFENIKGNDAIAIVNSDNVYIDNVVVDRLGGKNNLSGIRIHNSTNVTIANSVISKISSPRHSAGIKITGSKSANITIANNHIHETYGNGIISGGCSDCAATQTVHDTPVPRLKITNNLIHDTGKTPTPVRSSPTHGMYVKAQDAYIMGNTIYNIFDGQGISIRSTAVVLNNKVWDTRLAAIGFLQMKPPGNSMTSVVKNNELFFTKNKPPSLGAKSLLFLNWSKKSSYPLRYENFIVRNNKLAICTSNVEDLPLIKLYPFANLTIDRNKLIDRRQNQHFFDYLGTIDIDYEKRGHNTFSSSGCNTFNPKKST